MTREEILSQVTTVFTSILEHSNFELKNETTADDVDGWESITHMMLISEIEKVFKIKFKLMDLMNMDTVGDLLDTIEAEI